MKKPFLLCACVCGISSAQFSAGDTIAIDFGNIAPGTEYFNQVNATGTVTIADLLRLSDGTSTGASFTISGITGSNDGNGLNSQGVAPASTDATVYGDQVFSFVRNGQSLLSMSFSGLDDNLEFNVFGGGNRLASNVDSTWEVDGQIVTKTVGGDGYTNTYHSFDNVQTDGAGEVMISLYEAEGTGVAVVISELTLTAYSIDATDIANANSDALESVTTAANALALAQLEEDAITASQAGGLSAVEAAITGGNTSFQNLETVEEYVAAVNASSGVVDLADFVSNAELLTVADMDLTDDKVAATEEAATTYSVYESRIVVVDSDIVVDEASVRAAVDVSSITVEEFTEDDVTLTDATFAVTLEELSSEQIAELNSLGRIDADGALIDGVVPDSTTQTLNSASLSNMVGGLQSANSVTNLAFNGAHHRNLDSRLFESETLEWATIDYEQQDSTTRQFYELGIGSRLGTESYAFGLSLGISDQSSEIISSKGMGEIDVRGFVVNTELNKSFLREKLVVSGLFSFGVGSGSYNRDSSLSVTGGNGSLQYASITSDGITLTSVPLYSLPSSFILDESYSADLNSQYSAMRLRVDYRLFENRDFAFTPRVSYSSHQSSYDGYTEEGGVIPNTISDYEVTNETLRMGADFDWFMTDKFDVRFFAEGVRHTVSSYDIEASNQFESIQLSVDEFEDSYTRLGMELGWKFEGGLYGQFLVSRTSQEISTDLFSINLSAEF